jgi:hypothetical protein
MLLIIFLIAYFAANSVDAMEALVTLCFLSKEGQIIFERLILFYRHPFALLKSAHRIDVFTPN